MVHDQAMPQYPLREGSHVLQGRRRATHQQGSRLGGEHQVPRPAQTRVPRDIMLRQAGRANILNHRFALPRPSNSYPVMSDGIKSGVN
jgi:hypothetical protein